MLQIEPVTTEEEELIQELKRRTINELTPRLQQDQTLFYRFLKARNFNLDNAETMLRKHLAVRKQYQFDDFRESYTVPEHIQEYFPDSFLGFDKEGSVVRFLDVGGADHKGIVNLIDIKDVFRFLIYYIEDAIDRMTEQTKRLGKSVTQMVFIYDLSNFSLFQATYKRGLQNFNAVFKFLQDNYPERIKEVYLVNASYLLNICFPVFKTVLSDGLLQKIQIYGKNGWKEILRDKIDLDVLPAFLGGNRTDTDGNPLCLTILRRGKTVPEELYLNNNRKSLKERNDIETLRVKQFSCSEITVPVKHENSYLEWEFETKSKDIGFGLYYGQTSNSKTEELIPMQRIDTSLTSEIGVYKCDKLGTYTIVFDNSYSWIFSKEIYYKISLMESNEMSV